MNWLGDLLRACAAVPEADPGEIAALLGLARHRPAHPPAEEPAGAAERPPGHADLPGDLRDPPRHAPRARPARRPGPPASVPAGTRLLQPVTHEPPPELPWSVPPLPRTAPARPAPHMPLFAPRSAAGLIQALAARPVPEGPVDVVAAVERLARGEPLERLPRTPEPSLRYGVQLLIDKGPGMQPFARDQAELARRVQAVVGRESTQVRFFAYAPLRGAGPGPVWTWKPYVPPDPGTRVIVVSDLGLGGPPYDPRVSRREEWEALAKLLAEHRCGAVGLTPYGPGRWPRWLRQLFPLVQWDRTVTAAKARPR
ncbi:hypothetical protein [Thermoactinospora rubra]|uniref:hypothetical protein n=1 Tax=Thermoactinospora rubra TaxID=1088767 RepID=UPI000A0FE49A|nr:hypothetical protein [Thermoactinospora rubra]